MQIIPSETAIQIPQFKQSIQIYCKDIDINSSGDINPGGEALKEGFNWLGDKIAQGVAGGGQYINSKVEIKDDVGVEPETKIKVETVKSKISELEHTQITIGSCCVKESEIKQVITKQIDNSDSQGLKEGREIFVASWDAMRTALTGLGSALQKIDNQIGINTRVIVEKKYGLGCLGNIFGSKTKIFRFKTITITIMI